VEVFLPLFMGRGMMKGTVINKFRGSVEILQSGLTMIEELTNVPVVGVVPYMNVDIDDEDSLSERIISTSKTGLIDIAVIRLPKISNFTDFNVFERIPHVSIRYVKFADELKEPDMIIIPGTKNTMADLLWLRQNGLEALIKKQASNEAVIFGICGGYQMLGQTISDPNDVENSGRIDGIGLVDAETVFYKEKVRTQVRGKFNKINGVLEGLTDVEFVGYEIHMGKTTIGDNCHISTIIDTANKAESIDGCQNGNVYGTYIHGIFDRTEVANTIVESLLKNKGIEISNLANESAYDYKEKQYDLLADIVRKSVDMDMIYSILENGV